MDDTTLQTIIRDLGLEAYSPEQRELVITEIGENIMERSLARLHASLSDTQRVMLGEAIAAGKPEHALETLMKESPEIADTLAATAQEVIAEFKASA